MNNGKVTCCVSRETKTENSGRHGSQVTVQISMFVNHLRLSTAKCSTYSVKNTL